MRLPACGLNSGVVSLLRFNFGTDLDYLMSESGRNSEGVSLELATVITISRYFDQYPIGHYFLAVIVRHVHFLGGSGVV